MRRRRAASPQRRVSVAIGYFYGAGVFCGHGLTARDGRRVRDAARAVTARGGNSLWTGMADPRAGERRIGPAGAVTVRYMRRRSAALVLVLLLAAGPATERPHLHYDVYYLLLPCSRSTSRRTRRRHGGRASRSDRGHLRDARALARRRRCARPHRGRNAPAGRVPRVERVRRAAAADRPRVCRRRRGPRERERRAHRRRSRAGAGRPPARDHRSDHRVGGRGPTARGDGLLRGRRADLRRLRRYDLVYEDLGMTEIKPSRRDPYQPARLCRATVTRRGLPPDGRPGRGAGNRDPDVAGAAVLGRRAGGGPDGPVGHPRHPPRASRERRGPVVHTRAEVSRSMDLLDRLRPRWRHSDPEVRAAAARDLVPEDRDAVETLARDPDVRVRRVAVKKVTTRRCSTRLPGR